MKLVTIATMMLLTTSAFAADKSVTIINDSSHTIIKLQATNSGDSDWGENLLSNTIPPGDSQTADLEDGARTCLYDLKATLRGGFTAERRKINVCDLETWTIND